MRTNYPKEEDMDWKNYLTIEQELSKPDKERYTFDDSQRLVLKRAKPFKRPCKKCEKTFRPTTRHSKVCDPCLKKVRERLYKINRERNKKRGSK